MLQERDIITCSLYVTVFDFTQSFRSMTAVETKDHVQFPIRQ